MGHDTAVADLIRCDVNQMCSGSHFVSTQKPPTYMQLCDCRFMIADVDSTFPDSLKLFLHCVRTCSFVRTLAVVRRGDVQTTVQAMKHGAVDCVEKPIDRTRFSAAVEQVLCSRDATAAVIDERLTTTERVVLIGILQGRTTKTIAMDLHRSMRTIEVHRKNIKRKLRVSTLAELVICATSDTPGDTMATLSDRSSPRTFEVEDAS